MGKADLELQAWLKNRSGTMSGALISKVLLTGGAGFIGSHIVRLLLQKGYEVVVIDDLSTGSLPNLPNEGGIQFIQGSILDDDVLHSAISGCSAVIHLAALVSVPQGQVDPVMCADLNTMGSLRVMNACRRFNVPRFVQASSSAVYGSINEMPVSEDAPTCPISYYGASKLAAETYAQAASEDGLSCTSFRFFNVYGPRQDPKSQYSGVISIFIDRALLGKPVTIYGDGQQTRDFIYVQDVAAQVVAAISRTPGRHEILNVGTGSSINLLQLVEGIESVLSSKLTVEYGQARQGDIARSEASVAALQAISPFQPTSLEEALAATVEWVRRS